MPRDEFVRPGPTNSLTDVPGVRVGHVTLVTGEGALVPGRGPVRTGVTAIIPGDDVYDRKFVAGVHVINGFGKMIGLPQVAELGRLEMPILLTSTFSTWNAANGLIEYMLPRHPRMGIDGPTGNPVVGECNDGWLNDIRGRHVQAAHAVRALEEASAGAVEEGAVGAGTEMAFSTARAYPPYVPDEGELLNPFFAAAADVTEEAVVRALLAARPMTGRDGHYIDALTREQIERVCREWHGRG